MTGGAQSAMKQPQPERIGLPDRLVQDTLRAAVRVGWRGLPLCLALGSQTASLVRGELERPQMPQPSDH